MTIWLLIWLSVLELIYPKCWAIISNNNRDTLPTAVGIEPINTEHKIIAKHFPYTNIKIDFWVCSRTARQWPWVWQQSFVHGLAGFSRMNMSPGYGKICGCGTCGHNLFLCLTDFDDLKQVLGMWADVSARVVEEVNNGKTLALLRSDATQPASLTRLPVILANNMKTLFNHPTWTLYCCDSHVENLYYSKKKHIAPLLGSWVVVTALLANGEWAPIIHGLTKNGLSLWAPSIKWLLAKDEFWVIST